jgi:hypothetical protein
LWRDFIDKEDFSLEAAELRYEGPAAEKPEDAAWDAKMAAERTIADRTATTMAGIAVKLALWLCLYGASSSINATLDDAPPENYVAIASCRDAACLAVGRGFLRDRAGKNEPRH